GYNGIRDRPSIGARAGIPVHRGASLRGGHGRADRRRYRDPGRGPDKRTRASTATRAANADSLARRAFAVETGGRGPSAAAAARRPAVAAVSAIAVTLQFESSGRSTTAPARGASGLTSAAGAGGTVGACLRPSRA